MASINRDLTIMADQATSKATVIQPKRRVPFANDRSLQRELNRLGNARASLPSWISSAPSPTKG